MTVIFVVSTNFNFCEVTDFRFSLNLKVDLSAAEKVMAGPKMLKFNIAFALIGIVGGFAGFFIFVFALENFHAGK